MAMHLKDTLKCMSGTEPGSYCTIQYLLPLGGARQTSSPFCIDHAIDASSWRLSRHKLSLVDIPFDFRKGAGDFQTDLIVLY